MKDNKNLKRYILAFTKIFGILLGTAIIHIPKLYIDSYLENIWMPLTVGVFTIIGVIFGVVVCWACHEDKEN